jgi:predicted dehydrogenase
MRNAILLPVLLFPALLAAQGQANLVIVDPGHFHAALVQMDMYSLLSPRVSVYSPLSPELVDYLKRIAQFNSRPVNPTRWELEVHTGGGSFERMLRDRPGNIVMFTGKNRGKIDRILRSLEAGFHVFADKPWIIASADLPKLASALDLAEKKNLAAFDIMTERYEITSVLERELVQTPEVFGALSPGTAAEPAIRARSVHHIMKNVAGVPILRPVWFFDINEYGEALADVGTHVVDLGQWTAFPALPTDYRKDIAVLDARRWPTPVNGQQFRQVTGEAAFPAQLAAWVKDGQLQFYSNNFVHYTVHGVHAALDILWNWEAPENSGDIYEVAFRGTKSRIEIRQGKPEKYQPELYVVSAGPAEPVFEALRKKIDALGKSWPGLGVEIRGQEAHITIPAKYRVAHEAHFAQVTNAFFGYFQNPKSLPAWEKSNMLAKYYITTRGVEASHRNAP